MKKILLTSILTSILGVPTVGFSEAEDTRKNESYSSAARDMGGLQSHRQMLNQRKSQSQQAPKHHIGGISEDDMRAPRAKRPDQDSRNSHHVKEHSHKDHKNKKDDSEDENPNLANLTTPEPVNARNNLRISDEDRALNRQMMLDGPQGGFQNNQPRGIGGTSANF
ncbi:hypothetical protein LO80_01750 [Candidatus Francisella endociliophora]|uniref:Uncharacterized protein n=1 Tax=Candidatus Francisella endociliophora TaxID=653937 RepID=A0A097EMM7_9GAMM|nr:hypothetical protein [Francisella sp. FSC1006]AIT08824.1 hypothetical protein LO80_01750 [Francisella sp. FSC1006]